MDRLIAQHRGRIANTAGDSVLAEFPSVVEAVKCAVEVQEELREKNEGVPEERQLRFRIGVHMGDVMIRGGDLLGDGVNVAARLQALAHPGGVCLSGEAHQYTRKVLPLDYEDLGHQSVRNIEEPIKAYKIVGGREPSEPTSPAVAPKLSVPDRPSIAVLPFANMSDDRETEWFADGVVEDLITGLTRFKALLVIARNSSFTYKGRAVDAKQVARELGVRYVLEGSVRRAANRVRITTQLVDAETGAQVWADRYDALLNDIFAVQDELSGNLLSVLAPQLEKVEVARAKRKRFVDLDAYDLFLHALASMRTLTREGVDNALRLYNASIASDPEFAAAYAWAAMCYSIRKSRNWLVDIDQQSGEATRLARRAVYLGADDGVALCYGGHTLAYVGGDLQAGARASERAVALNPNFAPALWTSAFVNIWDGKPELALERLTRAVRLSPVDPDTPWFHAAIAHAHFHAERYDEAVIWASKSMAAGDIIDGARVLAAALGHLGRRDEAEAAVTKLRQIDPISCVSTLHQVLGPYRPEGLERYRVGLRKAGLAE
jgi:adenylate cyclase